MESKLTIFLWFVPRRCGHLDVVYFGRRRFVDRTRPEQRQSRPIRPHDARTLLNISHDVVPHPIGPHLQTRLLLEVWGRRDGVCWLDRQFGEATFEIPTLKVPKPFRCSSVRVGGALVRRRGLSDVIRVRSYNPEAATSTGPDAASATPFRNEIIWVLSFEGLRVPWVTECHQEKGRSVVGGESEGIYAFTRPEGVERALGFSFPPSSALSIDLVRATSRIFALGHKVVRWSCRAPVLNSGGHPPSFRLALRGSAYRTAGYCFWLLVISDSRGFKREGYKYRCIVTRTAVVCTWAEEIYDLFQSCWVWPFSLRAPPVRERVVVST